jgi:hypothetical protein
MGLHNNFVSVREYLNFTRFGTQMFHDQPHAVPHED